MKSAKPSVYAVIVNWNGLNDTKVCLESLQKADRHKADLSVVVVDNGSSDHSSEIIKQQFPWVTLIEARENLGFTGGNNRGIEFALAHGAQYIWLLNNDTIVDRDCLSFTDVFEDTSVGAAGSKIYFAPGHEFHRERYKKSEQGHVFWFAGGLIDWDNMYASHRGVDEVDHGQYDDVCETPFITGCSFVIRASVVRKIGFLDDAYYLYLEDLDWSLRVQKSGYKTMYAPMSVVWHINAGSSGKPGNPTHEYYITRNRLLAGFRYASLRTKFALVREATRFLISASAVRKRAVIDACLMKFGKQYVPKNIH